MRQTLLISRPICGTQGAGTRVAEAPTTVPPAVGQALFSLALAAGVFGAGVIGVLGWPDPAAAAQAVAAAGPALTRLLRAMAVIKGLLVAGIAATTLWRLQSPIAIPRLAAYAGLSVMMTLGVGAIWQMNRVGLGALLLHGGLAVSVVLLWRDSALHQRLAVLAARSPKHR